MLMKKLEMHDFGAGIVNVEEVFDGLGPIEQALLAGLFTWL